MPCGERLAVHPASHFGKPVVEGSEERKKYSPDDDVMKMRDHKIGIAELPVERRCAKHDSCQTRDQKLEEKTDAEEHRSPELNLPAPHRSDPIKDLDPGRNSDHHRGDGEETVGIRAHPNREHVMGPDAHADKSNANRRCNHHWISEDRLARENWNDFRNEGEGGNDQHVDFRMSENPEEMHPKDCGTSCLRVKEMPAEIPIDGKNNLR